MNKQKAYNQETEIHRSLQILNELSADGSLTQRDLSNRLGIALGLVNSYIKNLIAKGYITVKSIPPKRYAYFLTPKGFTEKTRLTYDLLQDYTRIYREAREGFKRLFREMGGNGVKRVVFAGSDEVAEIAYLTLQETDLVLAGIIDEDTVERTFFRKEVKSFKHVHTLNYDCIVITSYLKRETILNALISMGIEKSEIKMVFQI